MRNTERSLCASLLPHWSIAVRNKTKLSIRSGVRLATVCIVLALFSRARAGEPGITLEAASISNGGGVLPDGSVLIAGPLTVGAMSSENFTMEVGSVPAIAAACPASAAPVAELIGVDVSTKNRFLSFSAGSAGQSHAIRVTFDSLPPPFDLWNGSQLWVGPTSEVSEAGAVVDPDDAPKGRATFLAARLQCTPFFADFGVASVVHVFHEGIVPEGSYRVEVIDESCDAGVPTNFSEALPMTTAIWGDTLSSLSGTPPGPPDGPPVEIVDVLGILGAFSNADGAITKARADLEPGCLDLRINVTDVLSSIAGFTGLSYPFQATATDPCNSTCVNPLP